MAGDENPDPKVGTVLVPLVRREIGALLSLIAHMPRPSRAGPPTFAMSIDGHFLAGEKDRIASAFSTSSLRDARVSFIDCNLDPAQSFYLRTKPESFDAARHPYGWKSGPNRQFFASLRRLLGRHARHRSVLLMETDAFPLAPFWLDMLNGELSRLGPFLVAGARYRGLSELPPDIEGHINGNAVYAFADRRFPAFLDAWERVLLDMIPSAPWQAYDVTPEWARHNRKRASSAAAAPFYDRLAAMADGYVLPLRSIANFAGGHEASRPVDEHYPGFRSLRDVEIVHLRVPAPLRRWLERKKAVEMELGGETPASGHDAPILDHHWQFPAITELTAHRRAQAVLGGSEHFLYLGVPWATIIDHLLHKTEDALEFKALLQGLRERTSGRSRVVTVCQHVHMLDFLYLFERAGVTDIFWSHATKDIDFAIRDGLVRLHPFPLYPVQNVAWHDGERRLLFSFVGARGPFYPTAARRLIFDLLSADRRGVIVARESWHYDRVVHEHQVRHRPAVPTGATPEGLLDEAAAAEFRDVLSDSVFSLCPGGSGPNSIRLWESIGAGAIPVILSDRYLPPGEPALWHAAAVFCAETPQAVAALPERLAAMAADPALIAHKRRALRQLRFLYGPDNFIYDIQKLWLETPPEHAVPDPLPLDPLALSDLAERVGTGAAKADERTLFLSSYASRTMLDGQRFGETLLRHPQIASAHASAAGADPASGFVETAARAMHRACRRGNSAASTSRGALLKVSQLGRHRMRTPLAAAPYGRLFTGSLEFVAEPEDANLLVVGFAIDIQENAARIAQARDRNPRLKLVVLSEEPLWETVWSGRFHDSQASLVVAGTRFDYHNVNHANSRIYEFEKIPYYLTTRDDFFVRYGDLFRRNAQVAAHDVLKRWQASTCHAAFYAEKRLDKIYDVRFPQLGIEGLCVYRTRLAEAVPGERIARVGLGWIDRARRQDLPDWHLDKLTALDRSTFIVSGIENTHQRHYITEKLFDAFAVEAVPVYFADASHRIHDVVKPGSYLNVAGLTPEDAAARIAAFVPGLAFAEEYLAAQQRLSELFSSPATLLQERRRVARETVQALEAIART